MSETTGRSDGTDLRSEAHIVDCDLHITSIPDEVLSEYLPSRYRDRGLTIPTPGYAHPHGRTIHTQPDRMTPTRMRTDHLDEYDVDFGVITGSTTAQSISTHPNRDYATEVSRAHNEFVADTWLPSDDRLFGSVLVAPQDPTGAVELVDEFGSRPEFVQVVMGSSCDEGYGHPQYWPIYEAAVERGLPVAIHTGNDGAGIGHTVSAGNPTNYLEWHTALSAGYMSHVNSLVVEGVFEEFPDLTFVCIEGGFAWVPHLMWRLDKNWRGLRDQAPWLTRPPSEYIREHVRFTTQPIPEPERSEQLIQIFEMMSAEQTLLFSSDFPHWDTDDAALTLPRETPASMHDRIMYGNAAELYGFSIDEAGADR